ncbi:GAF domain-containing protein [Siccirubricoccus deserti]|uniref:GAF domain-containing protein n=1 Tax=Siccirubricoccus deserti TaxID=2013562 RepID=A0A9X0R3D7_9PROT|nr:GAF domain-containing protein [Siccirubricoccus deserti]
MPLRLPRPAKRAAGGDRRFPHHPECGLHPVLVGHGIVSLLSIQIRLDGNIWGMLEVDSGQPGQFDDLDAEFLEALAARCSAGRPSPGPTPAAVAYKDFGESWPLSPSIMIYDFRGSGWPSLGGF